MVMGHVPVWPEGRGRSDPVELLGFEKELFILSLFCDEIATLYLM
jgi:hypothetical protein